MPEANEDKIKEKAVSLGRAIGQTDSAKAMERAQENLKDDEETADLFEEVQEMEQEILGKVQSGEDVDESKQDELKEKMQKLESDPNFQKYMSAQMNLDKMMKKVNQFIQEGIEEGKDSNIIEV
jgi:cell fate (sporulation/competence/biofilm development) regulator YlbF (YheA/YmcA/DUF963 family)